MYSAIVDNFSDSSFHARSGDFGFVMDIEGHGINPINALMASLGACLGHYVRDYLRKENLDYRRFSVQASAGASQDGLRLGDIAVVIETSGISLTEKQKAELLRSVEVCKIHNTLIANSKISKVLNVG